MLHEQTKGIFDIFWSHDEHVTPPNGQLWKAIIGMFKEIEGVIWEFRRVGPKAHHLSFDDN